MDRKTGKGQKGWWLVAGQGLRVESKGKRRGILTCCAVLYGFAISLLPLAFHPASAHGAESWPGVDESVVEKFASERGREAHDPLINTDQGDLLLFVFLLAGTVGGFAAGYYWRMLIEGKKEIPARRKGKKG